MPRESTEGSRPLSLPPIPDLPRPPGRTEQDHVHARLRDAVMLGALPPGTALTFRGLAAALGVSATPVREAVRRLSAERAIEVLGNRRLRIPAMTAARFDELVALRLALETFAARRAFPHLSDMAVARLAALDARMDAAAAAGDLEALTRMNHAFHRGLYALNPDAESLLPIESVWLQLGPFQRGSLARIAFPAAVDRHKEMLAAMAARDLRGLCAALARDIEEGAIAVGRARLREGAGPEDGAGPEAP